MFSAVSIPLKSLAAPDRRFIARRRLRLELLTRTGFTNRLGTACYDTARYGAGTLWEGMASAMPLGL
jgi:hypothetical protein